MLGGVDEFGELDGDEVLVECWLYESQGDRDDRLSGGARMEGGDEFITSWGLGNEEKLRLGVTVDGDAMPAAI